mmetsp:Transcript_39091/g.120810  ORF Transcript_39091/g.120810 Transcript_39091/m.120810 type:complete len:236 (-) Transcript_39091:19-726(-)
MHHGHHLIGEEARRARLGRLLVALHGELLLRRARHAVHLRDHVAVPAHRLAGAALRNRRHLGQPARRVVARLGEEVGDRRGALLLAVNELREAVREAARQRELAVGHGVGATGNDDVGVARLDHVRSLDDGLEARGARHGDAVADDVLREVQVDDDLARAVGRVGLHDDVAPDDGVELLRVDLRLVDETRDGADGEADGVHLHQVAEGLDERRAHAGHDDSAALRLSRGRAEHPQ